MHIIHDRFFEFWRVFWDFGHMTTEASFTIMFDIALYPVVKRWVLRHDKRVHNKEIAK